MENTQIIKTIQLLSTKDKKKFKEFVGSPYFNKHQKTKLLLDYILSSLNKKTKKLLNREIVIKAIYPNEKHSYQKIKDLSSNLMKLLEHFMAIQEFEQQALIKSAYTSKYVYKIKSDEFLSKQISKFESKLKNHPYRDINYYKLHGEYLLIKNQLLSQIGKFKESASFKIKALNNHKIIYYLNILKLACSFKYYKVFYNSNFDSTDTEKIIEDIRNNYSDFSDHSLLILYYDIYNIFIGDSNSDENIKKIIRRLNENILSIPQFEADKIYSMIANYYSAKISKGEIKYAKDLFNLYKEIDKKNCMIRYNNISSSRYFNAIIMACEVGEFEWAESFAEKYNPYLLQIRKEHYKFSLGYIYYKKGDLNMVINTYKDLNFNQIHSTYIPRVMLIQTYMELEEWSVLDSQLESFRIYCVRKKDLSHTLRKGLINFITYAKKIMTIIQIKEPNIKENQASKLYEKISQNSNVA